MHIEKLAIEDYKQLQGLMRANCLYLERLEQEFNVQIDSYDKGIKIKGENADAKKTAQILSELISIIEADEYFDEQQFNYILLSHKKGDKINMEKLNEEILRTFEGKAIRPKTKGQKYYINTIKKNDITFGIGPAGTGKTFLAIACAVKALKDKEVQRIILTRPAIEAGENLGFLPGDLQEKVDPYLRPLYDALVEMLGLESFERYMEKGILEVAPLAYMRGRTLNDAFIILDEAQNTTSQQMKMFLTRFGFGSKAIVTGDITQTDLPDGKSSGLMHASGILKDVNGIGFVYLKAEDIIRHPVVSEIINAYDSAETS
ncbi:PhoH family protein [Proteinivorax hydrogeniformans]|uniref:PhoH-like protein n=1 Tax=Proteinivorax hydrogeniformans TaxID=1826727 RepID=A0AAU8HWU0_9FIRM